MPPDLTQIDPAAILALIERVRVAEAALTKAEAQFRFYAREHTNKGATEKAAANAIFADLCAEALKDPTP